MRALLWPPAFPRLPSPLPPPLRLPCQAIALDFLVEVRARHIQCARGLRHIPVVLLELREDVSPLGRLLELLERGHAHPRRRGEIRVARPAPAPPSLVPAAQPPDPPHAPDRAAEARPENEQPL